MKLFKWLLAISGFLITSIVLLLAYVTTALNPNDYRDQISQAVQEQAGLTLELEEINWSLFPWLGLDVGQTTLSTADNDTLAKLERVKVSVKLLPLLQKSIEIGDIQLAGATINIVKNADGSLNWDQLASKEHASTPDAEPASASKTPELDLMISSVSLVDATIDYKEVATASHYVIGSVNVTARQVQLNSARPVTQFPLSANLTFSDSQGLSISPELEAMVHINLPQQQFGLRALQLKTDAIAPTLPMPVSTELKADIDIALNEDRAQISHLTLSVNDLIVLSGTISANALTTAPRYKGDLTLAKTNLKALTKALEIALPETASANAIQSLEATIHFSGDTQQLELKPLSIVLDQSNINGFVSITDFTTQALAAELSIDQLNVDDYLPPASDTEADAVPDAARTDSTPPPSGNAPLIPIDTVKKLNLDATVKIGTLTASQITTKNLVLKVKGEEGLVTLNTIKGNTLEGNFNVTASLDVRGQKPTLRFKKDLNQIQLEPAMKALANSNLFAGTLFFGGDLRTEGNTIDEWTRNLTGQSQFKLDKGLMRGVNLTELAFSKLGALGPIAEAFLSDPAVQNKAIKNVPPAFQKESSIRELLADVVFDQGVARTDQLKLSLNDSEAKGSASFDLVNHTLDFTLNLTLSESLSNPYLAKIAWPIRCKGPVTAAPDCTIDTRPVRRAVEKLAKAKAKEEANAALAREIKKRTGVDLDGQSVEKAAKAELKAKEDEKKAEVKAELKRKEDEVKQKLEDELKNRFKGLF